LVTEACDRILIHNYLLTITHFVLSTCIASKLLKIGMNCSHNSRSSERYYGIYFQVCTNPQKYRKILSSGSTYTDIGTGKNSKLTRFEYWKQLYSVSFSFLIASSLYWLYFIWFSKLLVFCTSFTWLKKFPFHVHHFTPLLSFFYESKYAFIHSFIHSLQIFSSSLSS